jgi:putative transposase
VKPSLILGSRNPASTVALNLETWLSTNVPDGLGVFALPGRIRCRLRTSNHRDRLNKEIRRCTHVTGLFLNEASLLPVVIAILMAISEECETKGIYFRMKIGSLITQEV